MALPAREEFATANPHALATILEASQTRSIIATRDIFDFAGVKLWARDQPVSHALQRKLLDRKLRNPLESCLMAEDGVTAHSLLRSMEHLMAIDGPLHPLLAPHAARIVRETAHLPLHPVAQLLLTAANETRTDAYVHALQASAVCGALMCAHGGSTSELRLAMLAGLLHDLGEMYIDPHCGEADADQSLDFASYQQLVVHPHVGQLLLAQLTDYPSAVARAVAEHHERLDGSGYPHRLERDAISPLGRLLAVAENTLAVLRDRQPTLLQMSVSLRVVPGEFDLAWVKHVIGASLGAPTPQPRSSLPELQQRVQRLDTALRSANDLATVLLRENRTPALQRAVALATHLLERLRTGLNASGLWSGAALNERDLVEVEAVEEELSFRLRAIERATRLHAPDLEGADAERLARLCTTLHGR